MKVIQAELNRIAEEICTNICKYGEKYTKEEWEKMLEDNELPCYECPVLEIVL